MNYYLLVLAYLILCLLQLTWSGNRLEHPTLLKTGAYSIGATWAKDHVIGMSICNICSFFHRYF